MYPCVAILFEFRFFSHTLFVCSLVFVGGFPFSSMEEPRFTLYLVVEKRFRETFDMSGIVPMSIISPGGYYIGLRECPYQALVRAKLHTDEGKVTRESHILLKIHFSAAGYMHYATKSAGRDYAFSPVLHKRIYRKDKVDWKVWHFQDNLPMRWEASPGVSLVSSEWCDNPESWFLV